MKIKITCSVQEFEHIAKFFSSGEEVKQVATPFTVTTNTKEVKPIDLGTKPMDQEVKQTTPDVFTNLNWKEEQKNPKKKKKRKLRK